MTSEVDLERLSKSEMSRYGPAIVQTVKSFFKKSRRLSSIEKAKRCEREKLTSVPRDEDPKQADKVAPSNNSDRLPAVPGVVGRIAVLPAEDDEPVVEPVNQEEHYEEQAHRCVDEDVGEPVVRSLVEMEGDEDGRTANRRGAVSMADVCVAGKV